MIKIMGMSNAEESLCFLKDVGTKSCIRSIPPKDPISEVPSKLSSCLHAAITFNSAQYFS